MRRRKAACGGARARSVRAAVGLCALACAALGGMPSCTTRPRVAAVPPDEVSATAGELRRDVTILAADIGPRFAGSEALVRAEAHVAAALREAGLEVARQSFEARGHEVANLIAEIRGAGPLADEIIVVGAHYDTIPGTPGANDNGSGVAALLALARRLAGESPARTVRFVAFTNEEPPYFQTDLMGSVVYARSCRERGDNVIAMIALETMGYFADERGSQRYPPVVGWFFPSRGNFIGVIGDRKSGWLVRRVAKSFRRHSDLPCEAASLPGALPGVGWSDHWAFWQEGYPAVMITDTAPFRYPHYHEAGDTPDQLDYERFARAVIGLEHVVRELVGMR